jgi:SAM-dependent methyltransferase
MFLSSEQRAASADELYDGSYFRGAGGSGYVDYLQQKKSLVARGRRYAGLGSRLLGRSGRLLDIGAAAGFTMAGCRDSGWDVEGVEPNLTMVEYGRDAEALTFHHGCIDDVDFSARYDCILFLQVLEHIGDPVSTLRKALSILNPGGIVIVETWNVNSWPAKFLKHRWHQCNPPSVVHWYSPGSLTKLFGKEGFRLAGIGRPFKTTPVSNAIALLTSKLPFIRHLKPITIRALAGVSLPYPPVDVFWAAYTLRE